MTSATTTEDRLRQLAPRVLGAVVRRYGDFADAEDAVQEALIAAASAWPTSGVPDNPAGWLVRVASRRMADQHRSTEARRRREDLAASWSVTPAEPVPGTDDSLTLLLLCCHPALTAPSAIALTLRAVGGLTTREIASAFLVPEATMAQRISRAKATVKASGAAFELPPADERGQRLRSAMHVLYLIFNEGYAASSGAALARADLSGEAIRLARLLHASLPRDPEAAGLLALMLLTDARRPARTTAGGGLVPLAQQDRSLWDRRRITEGLQVLTASMGSGPMGDYQLQAAIAALHDQAPSHQATDWPRIVALYERLERLTANPMVTLNRAVAVAMVDGPAAGLALLRGLGAPLSNHHRFHAVRGHLLAMAGDTDGAIAELTVAAGRTLSIPEQRHLTLEIARLRAGLA